ncbi:hypothetical protein Tco_0007319 [Tanacetum coccineum]
MISLTVPSPIASPVATSTATISVDEDQFIKVGAQLKLYGSILYDHTQRLDAMPLTLFAGIDRDVRELYTRSGVSLGDVIFTKCDALEAWAGAMLIPDGQICLKLGFSDLDGFLTVSCCKTPLQSEGLRVEVGGRVYGFIEWTGYWWWCLGGGWGGVNTDLRGVECDWMMEMESGGLGAGRGGGGGAGLVGCGGRAMGELEETPLEETNSLEGQCIELGNRISLWMIVVEDSS